MNEPTTRIQFRVDDRLQKAIADRVTSPSESPGLVARRILHYYLALLAHGQNEIARLGLSEREALLIMDACNGTLFGPESAHLIWAEVQEAISLNNLDQKWNVDGDRLVNKLRSLSPAGLFALTDFVQRFWSGNVPNSRQRLEEIGFPVSP